MKLASSQMGKTRAETARQKRTETSQTRVTRVNRNVVAPIHRTPQTPPVTVRGTGSGTPVRQKTKGKARRQYYYALGATGAEVRMPAMPAINPGWRVLSAVLVLALFAGIWMAYNLPQFQVEKVKITGLKRLKPADIEAVLDLKNTPIFTVDPQNITLTLKKNFPELNDLSVTASLPAAVTITASERQPILAWKYKDSTYWVDKDGTIFLPRGSVKGLVKIESDELPPVVIDNIPLTGALEPSTSDASNADKTSEAVKLPADLVGKTMEPVILNAARGLSKVVPSGTALAYTSKNGMGWSDPDGWQVYIGMDLDNIDLKLKMYKAVVQKLNSDGVKPAMISVENVNAPFYRLEQ